MSVISAASVASVKVAVRVRPMAAKELLANSKDCVEIIPGTQQIIVGGGPSGSGVGSETIYNFTQKSFTFDYLFDENSTQEDLYGLAVAPLVERFLEGFNATILAYGQTGSGKTYSMGIGLDGLTSAPVDFNNKGIVPRAISTIFTKMAASKQENSSYEAGVTVSFMELYNEELVDLLNPRPRSASTATQNNMGPTIREDGNGKIMWVNLSEERVNSTSELLTVLQKGTLCRTTGSTDMNASSSRSHAIFTVTLRQTYEVPKENNGGGGDDKGGGGGEKVNLVSKFHFVDLAGSERLKRTNAEGDRKKEGISINQGLLALGNVISALGDEARKAGHVPYRDSKLTRMLQDSLGGNSQTVMLACVSPSDLNYGETVNTLHYANRARNIKNRVAINQDWGNSVGGEAQREIKSLRLTISQLRTEIAMIRAGGEEIHDAELETMAPISNLVGQTKLHYHQRRERDHLAEIDRLKSDASNSSFQLDRFHFLSIRLARQVRELMDENMRLTQERDVSIAEKCRILNPKNGFVTEFSRQDAAPPPSVGAVVDGSVIDMDTLSDTQPPSTPRRNRTPPEEHHVHPIIRQYVQTISQLRLQLADCEDKLAWQYEAMSKLGQKGSKANLAWSVQCLKELDISSAPSSKRLDQVQKDVAKPGIDGERKLLDAIRENIELNEANKRNDYSLLSEKSSGAGGKNKMLMGGEGGSLTGLSNEISLDTLQMQGGEDDIDDIDDAEQNHQDEQQGPDIYMLINKLQNDIVQHEALAESIQKREDEYNRMQKAYEGKLSVLQNQMVQFQEERDLALKKMTNGSKEQRSHVKNKYDEAKRRLDSEISDTRRKLGENTRMQSNSKSRAEKLTGELQATITSLKTEKTRMLQELRVQTQKHRDSNNASMREISKLRRKEKNTSDIAKRLERSNQLQRLMLKKRNQEVMQTQMKLKQIMQSLKRAATPNKVLKTQQQPSGMSSPVPRNIKTARGGRVSALSGPAMNEILASVNSPVRVSVSHSLAEARPEVDIRAQFKKQMVDKELASTVLCRKTQKNLLQLQKLRNRLTEEQKELISERKRVVDATFRETGVLDEKSSQYMDERVQTIDVEVASIDNSMVTLEEKLRLSCGILDSSFLGDSINNVVDLNWENALNLLRSLDRIELEATLAYFLEDVVTLRSLEDEYVQEIESKEQVVANLNQQLQDIQEALYSQVKKLKVVNFADESEMYSSPSSPYDEKTIGEALALEESIDIDDYDSPSSGSLGGLSSSKAHPLPRLAGALRLEGGVTTSEIDTLQAPLAVRIPSPSRKNGVRPISLSPSRLSNNNSSTINSAVDEAIMGMGGGENSNNARGRTSRKEGNSPQPSSANSSSSAATSIMKKLDRPLSPLKELSRPNSTSPFRKDEQQPHQPWEKTYSHPSSLFSMTSSNLSNSNTSGMASTITPANDNGLEESIKPPQPKKRYDFLSFAAVAAASNSSTTGAASTNNSSANSSSSDVFQRLANAHTLASQAKVIQRSTLIDKEALMQDVSHNNNNSSNNLLHGYNSNIEGKRKSLSEMEQSWHE